MIEMSVVSKLAERERVIEIEEPKGGEIGEAFICIGGEVGSEKLVSTN